MQSDIKHIYKLTSERTGKPEQLYKDIGNFVQQEVYEQLKKPKSLIIKLKGVGFWFLRKKRLEKAVSYYPENYEEYGYEDFPSENAFLRYENKKELFKIFKERLKDYDKYLQKKKETKLKKNESKEISGSEEDSQ